jgi:hypothetical protein
MAEWMPVSDHVFQTAANLSCFEDAGFAHRSSESL